MLVSILTGLGMAASTIAIHAVGTFGWIEYLKKRVRKTRSNSIGTLKLLCSTAVALLLVHIVEVALWAAAYFLLVPGKQFANFEQAVYFSTVTFASLGYGDIVIQGSWRLLSAMQSMVGLLVFGWSSALLYAVVQNLLRDQQMQADDKTPW